MTSNHLFSQSDYLYDLALSNLFHFNADFIIMPRHIKGLHIYHSPQFHCLRHRQHRNHEKFGLQ